MSQNCLRKYPSGSGAKKNVPENVFGGADVQLDMIQNVSGEGHGGLHGWQPALRQTRDRLACGLGGASY